MAKMIVSDEDFIKSWEELKSPYALAKRYDINVRQVFKRRRKIEERYKISLEVIPMAEKYINPGLEKIKLNKILTQTRHNVRRGVELEKGRVIVFSDAHFFPDEETTAYLALLECIKEFKPDVIICNGDAFDGSRLSRFPRINWTETPTVKQELDAVKHYLGEIESVSKHKSNLIWTLGNHDSRFETMLSNSAGHNYEGIEGFSLKDHFPLWQPCWSFWVNDNTVIKHRWKGGKYAGSNNTTFSGKNIVTGHTHQLKVEPFTDYNGTRYGVQTGTLAYPKGDQFIDYTEDNPVDWRSGFVLLTYHKNQLLMPEIIQVWDEEENEVEFRGKVHQV